MLKDSEAVTTDDIDTLLKLLATSATWLSLHSWPQVVDNLFARAEEMGMLQVDQENMGDCLKCIGNEEICSRYATYVLGRYVRSRIWFGQDPMLVIKSAEPYITVDSAKKELHGIVRYMESINKEWKHLLEKPAPDFRFENVKGEMVSLSDFRGYFVLLDVWNIYCGICILQMPYLRKLEPELEKLGVQIIGISSDSQNLKEKWKTFVEEEEMLGVQVIMDKGLSSQFIKDYCVSSFPVFCLINPDGYVVHARLPLPQSQKFMQIVQQEVDAYNIKKRDHPLRVVSTQVPVPIEGFKI